MTVALLLLRLVPLLATTSSLTFTLSEHLYLAPYTQPAFGLGSPARAAANLILPPYIKRWFPRGFGVILVLYPLSWATAIANLAVTDAGLNLHGETGDSKAAFGLYLAGLFFSVGHFLWGPRAKALMGAISGGKAGNTGDEDEASDKVSVLKVWTKMNIVRGLVVDLPGWACFFAGFLVAVGSSL